MHRSRNCSGGSSISQGLVSSGILNGNPAAVAAAAAGSNPVMIPGSGKLSPPGLQQQLQQQQMENGHDGNVSWRYWPQLNSKPNLSLSLFQPNMMGMNQLGLFDLTTSSPKSSSSNMDNGVSKDLEIARLKEELNMARGRLSSWEDVRTACEAWKKETALSEKKVELALKEKEDAVAKIAMLQKEVDHLSGGPYLHAVKRVGDLKGLPAGVLKTIEWQLRQDLQEVEKVWIMILTQWGDLLFVSLHLNR